MKHAVPVTKESTSYCAIAAPMAQLDICFCSIPFYTSTSSLMRLFMATQLKTHETRGQKSFFQQNQQVRAVRVMQCMCSSLHICCNFFISTSLESTESIIFNKRAHRALDFMQDVSKGRLWLNILVRRRARERVREMNWKEMDVIWKNLGDSEAKQPFLGGKMRMNLPRRTYGWIFHAGLCRLWGRSRNY